MPNVGFREIADRLRSSIASGELAAGAPLRSESELCTEYGVTRTTVRRAFGLLEDEGIVDVVPGRGRFVRLPAGSSAPRTGTRTEEVADSLRQQRENGTARDGELIGTETAIADRFGVSPGTARQALQDLAGQGFVTAVHGRGWFWGGPERSLTRTDETAQALRAAIASGELPVGARLPGELALAERYGVGRITVRRAVAELENEGLVEKRPGYGRVVLRNDKVS